MPDITSVIQALSIAIDAVIHGSSKIFEARRMGELQKEHEALLHKSAEMTTNDIAQIYDFLNTLVQAGEVISDAEHRSQLRTLIRYWASFINDKEGSFPATQILPFNNSKSQMLPIQAKSEETSIEHQVKELEVNEKRLEEQSRQVQAQETHPGIQQSPQGIDKRIELERQKLELEKQQLELDKKRLELERHRIDYALEVASKMIDILNPNPDPETREMLLKSLLPNLLQLGNVKGLELVSSASSKSEAFISHEKGASPQQDQATQYNAVGDSNKTNVKDDEASKQSSQSDSV